MLQALITRNALYAQPAVLPRKSNRLVARRVASASTLLDKANQHALNALKATSALLLVLLRAHHVKLVSIKIRHNKQDAKFVKLALTLR
jgi:hypothetical protein